MDQTKKPRIVVEDKKGKVEWIERMPPTMSELCKQCDLSLPVNYNGNDTEPDYSYPEMQPIAMQVSNLFVDLNDTIHFRGNKLRPTWLNISSTIDRWLLGYFYLQYDLQHRKESAIPTFFSESILSLAKYKDRKEKNWILGLPEKRETDSNDEIQLIYSAFALNAQLTLLSQRLFLRRHASKAMFSPEHVCCFYNYAMWKKLKKAENSTNQDKKEAVDFISDYLFQGNSKFKLEDYILYERVTACSLFIELSAALSCVDDSSREVCLDVLKDKQNLKSFLACPNLLSRIAVARQFVFEAASLLQRQFRHTRLSGKELQKAKHSEAQKVMTLLLNVWDISWHEPSCFLESVDPKNKEACCEKLLWRINSIQAPINIMAYINNPVYGPVMFCNPRHEGVGIPCNGTGGVALLEDVQRFNRLPKKPAQKHSAAWNYFIQLCEAAGNIAATQ